jgi:steroid 5-alpha reductase family enzyme
MWIISAPIISAMTSGFPAILTPLDWLGAVLWVFGFLFESIGDLQLMLFKANPANRGKLFTGGLWKYTRHPNYFGEAVLWWGFYLIAVAAGKWWTLFSPVIMTYLLLRVSGVSMLERTMKQKPGYQDYMRKTSAFVPWLPKS